MAHLAKQMNEIAWIGYFHPRHRLSHLFHAFRNYHNIHNNAHTNNVKAPFMDDRPPYALMVSLMHESPVRTKVEAESIVQSWMQSLLHVSDATLSNSNDIKYVVVDGDLVRFDTTSIDTMVKLAEWLSQQSQVHFIERRQRHTINNKWSRAVLQNGLNTANYTSRTGLVSWDFNLSGNNQIVAVSDDGLDYNSCYFYDPAKGSAPMRNFDASPDAPPQNAGDLTQRKVVQYVYGSSIGDNLGDEHGTHTSGSVAGSPCPTCSTLAAYDQFSGMAPSAKLAFFDIGVTGQDSLSLPNNLRTQLLPWGYAIGARIHSASWGSDSNTYALEDNQFDDYHFWNQDFVALIAAGNSGAQGINSLGSPAVAKNVISVGASINSANMWQETFGVGGISPNTNMFNYYANTQASHFTINSVAGFSSIGPTADRRTKPDIVAPGYFVISAKYQQAVGTSCKSNTLTNSIKLLAGTSMATPNTAGTLALIREYFTAGFYPCGAANSSRTMTPSGALLKATLISSAQELTGDQDVQNADQQDSGQYRSISRASQGYPNIYQGYGRPNLKRTLRFNDNNSPKLIIPRDVDNTRGFGDPRLSVGQQHTYEVVIDSVNTYLPKFTLVWTDRAATSSSGQNLVNDLDLIVNLKNTSTMFYGNNEVNPSTTGSSSRNPSTQPDRTSNVEQVILRSATAGSVYLVIVRGVNIPSGLNGFQSYALVMSGDMRLTTSDPVTACASGTIPYPIPSAVPLSTCTPACSQFGGCIATNVCACLEGFSGSTCTTYPSQVFITLRIKNTNFASLNDQTRATLSNNLVSDVSGVLSISSEQVKVVNIKDGTNTAVLIQFTVTSPCATFPCLNATNSRSSRQLRDDLQLLVMNPSSALYQSQYTVLRNTDYNYFSASLTATDDGFSSDKNNSVGVGVGSAVGILIFLIIVYLAYRWWQRRRQSAKPANVTMQPQYLPAQQPGYIQNQPAQNYPAQNYPAQNYPAQNYPAQNYPAQNYPAQNYPVQYLPAQQPGYTQNYPPQNHPPPAYSQ